jgi:hypothetical protein
MCFCNSVDVFALALLRAATVRERCGNTAPRSLTVAARHEEFGKWFFERYLHIILIGNSTASEVTNMSEHAANEHIAAGEPGAHGHDSAHLAAAAHFTDAEWANFQREDYSAGRAVVVLMLSIFLTGVVIYSIVAYWVIFFSRA